MDQLKELSFTLNNSFNKNLWEGDDEKFISGNYIASCIFSVWAFKTNKNIPIVSSIASNIITEIENIISESKKEINIQISEYQERLDHPVNKSLTSNIFEREKYTITLDEKFQNPICAAFVNLFLTADFATSLASGLHEIGDFSTQDLKKAERNITRKLNKAMSDINRKSISFHRSRKKSI